MHRLETLWRLVNAVGTVRDLASESKTLAYFVPTATTLYLHIDAGHVMLKKTAERYVRIQTIVQPPFGWRIHSEQDDAGVYLVAKRRQGLGSVASAQFNISVPQDVYIILKAEGCDVTLGNLNGTLHLQADGEAYIDK